MAYFHLNPGQQKWTSPLKTFETLVNMFFILFGAYILVGGTYVGFHPPLLCPIWRSLQVSIQSIIDSYQAQLVGGVFTCVSNALWACQLRLVQTHDCLTATPDGWLVKESLLSLFKDKTCWSNDVASLPASVEKRPWEVRDRQPPEKALDSDSRTIWARGGVWRSPCLRQITVGFQSWMNPGPTL